jgi:uncharacterized protein with HEPN domain
MSRRDPRVTLSQMLDSAREARALVQKKSRTDLDRERTLELSVIRLLEVIGEAATRLPGEVQENHPDVPWASIVGLRNRLIHGYDDVDLDVVWMILTDDLPVLIGRLQEMLGEQGL